MAQDFFTYQVGMKFYLNGSLSPFLSKGKDMLEEVADRYKDSMLGARAATVLANAVGRPFFRIENNVITKTHKPDPQAALALTKPVLDMYQEKKSPALNLDYRQLVCQRAECMKASGEHDEAIGELTTLISDLKACGVNQPVLDEIEKYERSISTGGRKKRSAP